MSTDAGFVLIYRSLLGHHAFRNDAEAMAFAWLVMKASWQPTRVRYKGHVIELARGECAISVRDMAEAFERPKGWVERLLTRLKNETMIETRAGTDARTAPLVVNIRNYDVFQAKVPEARTASRTVSRTADETAPGQHPDTEQRREQGNKGLSSDKPIRATRSKTVATRLPDGWRPETLDRSTIAGEIANRRGQAWMKRAFETFDNHWRAKSGKDATKADWQRTWSNWVIEQDRREGGSNARNGRSSRPESGFGTTADAVGDFLNDLGGSTH